MMYIKLIKCHLILVCLLEYLKCINNPYCSARTISLYVSKYAQDCNKDGVLDCADVMQLHVQGPSGCRDNKKIDTKLKDRYNNCTQRILDNNLI